MIWLRATLFNFAFYLNTLLFVVLGVGFFFTPRRWSMAALKIWARSCLWLLRVIVGTKMEVRGQDYIQQGAGLFAVKHQSIWETFALLPIFGDPALVLKRELGFIPFFGWFIFKFQMIAIVRQSGQHALRTMLVAARHLHAQGRQIIIFPEGTRRPTDGIALYKSGTAALYQALSVPCVPVALNSGLYWPRRSWQRRPGTIIVEFLPPIPAGLPRQIFQKKLQDSIEEATARLVQEGQETFLQ